MMKAMDLASWLGANRSDTSWYREDLQRRHGAKDALSCSEISVAAY
jgi:replicative superfamily II helicase